MSTVFTIGHSTQDWTTFEQLLVSAEIASVVDVRSNPASRLPHFNRAALTARLNASGIAYVFMGAELGGRPSREVVPDYDCIANTAAFNRGIEQVERLASRTRLALMCSEHEPLTCHRCLLVGRSLAKRGVAVAHILRDGAISAANVHFVRGH